MVFSSIIFMYYFIPIFFLVYYLVKDKYKNQCCLLFSMVFYGWGEPYYIVLMLCSMGMNYGFGRLLDHEKPENIRKWWMITATVFNIGLLFVFKYLPFFGNAVGLSVPQLALPLGISFYTFQTMSYIWDVYRKDVPVQKKFTNLALYISMFPQLVAGPIVRYSDVNNQIDSRVHTVSGVSHGIFRFAIGLGKKVILANGLASVADGIWHLQISQLSTVSAWVGVVAYSLQIYFDFSGYSDMAIGLGQMMGFQFQENFNYPYISKSVSEFWRRWHMSLGSWFRDYVYFPLGGSRVSKGHMVCNLFVVWALTGLWHGANWTFLAWGIYYGLFITVEKLVKLPGKSWNLGKHLGCLLIIMVGWVLFRSDSIWAAGDFVGRMFAVAPGSLLDGTAIYYLHDYGLLILVSCFGCLPLVKNWGKKFATRYGTWSGYPVVQGVGILALVGLCTIFLANSTYNPFIYFRF